MKKIIIPIICIIALVLLCICLYFFTNKSNEQESDIMSSSQNKENTRMEITEEKEENMKININVNNNNLTATLIDNSSSRALIEKLKENSITINMSDYSNFEKVGNLGFNLPRNDESITTKPGDIILYQGNQITIYYDTNSWSFTKLGEIDNISQSELKEILGNGNVEVTISLASNNLNNVSTAKREFNFETKKVKLNNGLEMPINGIGTYSLHDETCVNSVYIAIKNGYRLVDTAYMYGNEKEVGQAVRKAIGEGIIKREDIFVITKIYPNQFSNAKQAIQERLDKLDIEYVDMMLLHHPGDNDVEAYKEMENFVREGKIKSLGLSNYYIEEIDDFYDSVNIKPSLVQNEIHPYYTESKVIPYIQNKGIVMQAWYPLGGRGHQTELLNDETLKQIAENHNKSVAQVILRWDLQNGVVVIPGSSNPDHIKENIELYNFELSEEEMNQINNLNRDEKHDWY